VRECRRPANNCPSGEKLPKLAFPVVPRFLEPEGMKTPLIIALYAILWNFLVSEYPPLKRLYGRFLRKWPRRQIEVTVSMSLEKGSTSSCLSREYSVTAKSPEADGYVHNSPLRFELATHPQPLLPDRRKEEDAAHSHIDVGSPQAVACGFILPESSWRLRVDNPEKRRQESSKRGRVWQPSIDVKSPLCYHYERGNWMGLYVAINSRNRWQLSPEYAVSKISKVSVSEL
jgi:hypothetical protein